MSALLLAIPLLCGWAFTRRCLDERDPGLALGAAVGVGALGYVTLVAALLPLLPVRASMGVALGLQAIAAAGLWVRLPARRLRPWLFAPSRRPLGPEALCTTRWVTTAAAGAGTAWAAWSTWLDFPARPWVRLVFAGAVAGGGALVTVQVGRTWWSRAQGLVRGLRALGPASALLAVALVGGCMFLSTAGSIIPDDDYFIHAPHVRALLDGVFPLRNPYLPANELNGHYGRSLLLSLEVWLTGETPLGAMKTQMLVLQVASALLVARLLGARAGRIAGLCAMLLIFFGIPFGLGQAVAVRCGLSEVYGNNNPIAHLALFTLVYALVRIFRGRSLLAALAGGALLGGYVPIYETHFVALSGGVAGLGALTLLRGWRRARVRALAVTLVAATLVAVWVEGPVHRMVWPGRARETLDTTPLTLTSMAGINQSVGVKFPRRPFLHVTRPEGGDVSLFSAEMWERDGLVLRAFPLLLLCALLRWRPLPLLCAGTALCALAIPGALDFGRFNSEILRYVCLFGLMCGLLAGWTLGELSAWGRRRSPWMHQASVCGVVLITLLCTAPGLAVIDRYRRRYDPGLWERDPRRWMQTDFGPGFAPVEWELIDALVRESRPGEWLLPSFPSGPLRDSWLASVMSLASARLTGASLVVAEQTSMVRANMVVTGPRARAFWLTGELDLARDLGATWLLIRDETLSPAVLARLLASPALRRVADVVDPASGQHRRLLRLEAPPLPRGAGEPVAEAEAGRVRVEWPEAAALCEGGVLPVRVVLHNESDRPIALGPDARLIARVYDPERRLELNALDWVATPLPATLAPGAAVALQTWVPAPLHPGEYLVDPALVPSWWAPRACAPGRPLRLLVLPLPPRVTPSLWAIPDDL